MPQPTVENIWKVKDADRWAVNDLVEHARLVKAVATVAVARGIDTPEKWNAHTQIGPHMLHDPRLLPDIDAVVSRLSQAIDSGERIWLWGDYDVDGTTATAICAEALMEMGASVEWHVPNRMLDGYDLRPRIIDRAKEGGANLIVTVDCGIVAFEAALRAKELGIDLIITDHHEPRDDGTIPEAIGVVNPHRHDSQYPFSELAGAGIAFKVMLALAMHRDPTLALMKKLRSDLVEYVALATIADVAQLTDENRALVVVGCRALTKTKRAGVRALLKASGVTTVGSGSIGFGLGPRINAIGRLDDSRIALNLLLEKDENEAHVLSHQLETANKRRQEMQAAMEAEAMALLEHGGLLEKYPNVNVVWARSWHRGIVGLGAGKLAEATGRPTLMLQEFEDGTATGSARSAGGFNMIEALRSPGITELFQRCGGHMFAAGFTLAAENLPILRERLNEYAVGKVSESPTRVLHIDAYLGHRDITQTTFDDLQKLGPFGADGSGSPEPLFLIERIKLQSASFLGKEGKHLELTLKGTSGYGNAIKAKWWRAGHMMESLKAGSLYDVVGKLSMNEWMGRTTLAIEVQDLRLVERVI